MRDELTSAWHEVTPDARSIFMKMEPSPPLRVCQYHASVRVQWKVGRVYSIVDNRVRLLDGQFEIDIFRARSLSIFFFYLVLSISSPLLFVSRNKREREREGGREKDIKNR